MEHNGNESSRAATQGNFVESNRDSALPIYYPFQSSHESVSESVYESFAQLHNQNETTIWRREGRPQTADDIAYFSVDDVYDEEWMCGQPSKSPIKKPVKGRDFLMKASF